MSRRLIALCTVVTLAGLLAGCAADPWVDSRREAGTVLMVGDSTPDRVAICHGGDADPQVLRDMAARECAVTGRSPHFVGMTRFQCRLITPHRSYFDCR